MNKYLSYFCILIFAVINGTEVKAEFRAGAAVVDVTPDKLPAIINGGMLKRTAKEVNTPVNARTIVLDDGNERIAIVVVDSCMIPRMVADDAKALAFKKTGIKEDHILISATHTHSAPASMSCLGTTCDPDYQVFLRNRIAKAIAEAEKNLEPARVGWGTIDANEFTALRRWIIAPGKMGTDPFGNVSMRAQMHAGRVWENVTGESGPEDPELSLISFRSKSGKPIAVLANFSMHYFGDQAISADYFGLFSEGLKKRIAPGSDDDSSGFVGIMSHGCSGDIYKTDYTKKQEDRNPVIAKIDSFTEGLLEKAVSAYQAIEYQDNPKLGMEETRLHLNYRVPDKQRLEWAQNIVKQMGDREPKTTTEVYAREQVILDELQSTDVVLQGIKIGNIVIGSFPTETYALTGLKVKSQSPYEKTMVIELANGGDGYIPPPEQHFLGGYNTWAARSAGLENQAEPKMTEAVINLIEKVTGQPRRSPKLSRGPGVKNILKLNPTAYWRLDEMQNGHAVDESGNGQDGFYEQGVVYFLEGAKSNLFCEKEQKNRAAHFAGGRMRSNLSEVDDEYTVSLWFWNGIDYGARDLAGWMFSRDHNQGTSPSGVHLGLGGNQNAGKLILQSGDQLHWGNSSVKRWEWNHAVLVKDGSSFKVYLNQSETPEIEVDVNQDSSQLITDFFLGGRSDNDSNWEGRLDEIAVFNRALTDEEIRSLGDEQE